MKPDPQKTANLWLEQSEHDLTAADTLLNGGHFEQACFYSQQAAEKAVKAVGYLRGSRFVIGHSVSWLLKQVLEFYPRLKDHLDSANALDQVYVTSRYPNSLPDSAPYMVFSQRQARDAVGMAREIIQDVASIVRHS